jgi:hypothetical protein
MIRRDYVQSLYEPIVKEILANVKDVEEKKKYTFDSKEKNKTIEVEYLEITPSGAKMLRAKIYDKDTKNNADTKNIVDIIITYAPTVQPDQEATKYYPIYHILEKSRWSKALSKRYDETNTKVYFPTPFGTGDETPTTHHWSEYAGKKLSLYFGDNINVDSITAKLASALTAKDETIEDILKAKYPANKRKIDALTFDNPNPKHVLSRYLNNAQSRLETALEKYEKVRKEITRTDEEKSKANNGIDVAKKNKKKLQDLKEKLEKATFTYNPEDYVLIHFDLISLDNILVDGENEVWFIDGIIPESPGQQSVLDTYVGPKQIYYYVFKEHLKAHKEDGDGSSPFGDSRETSIRYATNKTALLENLEKILHQDFEIEVKNKENNDFIGEIVSAYFEAGKMRKDAIKLCKGDSTQNGRQGKNKITQLKMFPENVQAERVNANSQDNKDQGPPAEPKPDKPVSTSEEASK